MLEQWKTSCAVGYMKQASRACLADERPIVCLLSSRERPCHFHAPWTDYVRAAESAYSAVRSMVRRPCCNCSGQVWVLGACKRDSGVHLARRPVQSS